MHMPSRYWADCSTHAIAQSQRNGTWQHTIAVLPVAATEQHGPHLPLRVDTALVDGVIAAALPHLAQDVPALFLPTQTLGLSPEHAQFPGTLTLQPETILKVWSDIATSVAASGVKKLVLFNSHGGNVAVMDMVARDARARLGLLVYSASWYNLPLVGPQGEDVNALFGADEHRFGIHAGDMETSMMLALAPEQVDMAQAQHFHSTSQDRAQRFAILGNGQSAKLGWQMQDYNAQGAVGNAAAATAEKGRALLDAAGRALAAMLAEVHQLPLDTLVQRVPD